MDLRNLCSKIDMDSIRAKFPHMPAMPAMPQIKLPKSMPKLKSRKIFRSSREDVSKASQKRPNQPSSLEVHQTHIKPADFINRTPTRISTISSLMQQHTGSRRGDGGKTESFERYDSSTYRRANSIDDDYPSAATLHGELYLESPARTPVTAGAKLNSPTIAGSSANVKMSFSEKMQKGYKDLTEFRFKHILAKKTVVRSDNIEVDYYVQRYNEDRIVEEREQMQHDREIADNFRFKFKESRQSTVHSSSISPSDSPVMQQPRKKSEQLEERGKAAQSDDESGMEATPPPRRLIDGGISKNPLRPLRRGESQASNSDNENGDKFQRAPIPSSLWAIKDKNSDQTATEKIVGPATTKKSYKERMRRLTSYVSSHDESGAESATEASGSTTLSKLRNLGKRQHVEDDENVGTDHEEEVREGSRAKFASQQSLNDKSAEKPLDTIKQNLKRFKSTMSLKRQPTPAATNDTDDENVKAATSPTSTRNKIAARLRRFKSRDVSSVDEVDNDENTEVSKRSAHGSGGSPLRAAINNKLQAWKKSFKKKPEETNGTDVGTEDERSPEAKPTRSSTLIKKLKYIRSRKNPNSNDDLDAQEDDDDEAAVDRKKTNETSKSRGKNLEEKFENARQRTMKRVNDKMQKMKIFNKSQDNAGKEEIDNAAVKCSNVPPPISRRRDIRDDADEENSSDNEDIEEISNRPGEYAATKKIHAVWTTQPILSDSTESDDNDGEYPRVLIHQDNSDLFESTLIIAVTTSAATASPRPKITEILSKNSPKETPKALNPVSDKETISGFLDTTPPSERKTSAGDKSEWATPTARGHTRRLSMDSNSDSDSWMPENVRGKPLSNMNSKEDTRRTSAAGLNSIKENEESWRVHSAYPEDKLYKTRSIDIFAENVKRGAFEDFDDELKNEPVLKIVRKANNEVHERDGKKRSEDADAVDDVNSMRVSKICIENISVEEHSELITRNESPKSMHTTRDEYKNRRFGNSRESLDANFDENEEYTEDEDDYDDEDRPPSAAPSPPPTMPPPPPPLPQRQPSLRLPKPIVTAAEEMLPPLPETKPPPVPITKQPPKIPERTESMSRIAKPLVKTSSLRLAYTEQVKPADVGKVNKLISRFEQPTTAAESTVRPRIRAKALMRDESEDYSDYEEKEEEDDDNDEEDNYHEKMNDINDNDWSSNHETTPTPPQKLSATQDSYNTGVEETKPITKKRIAPKPESILSNISKTKQVPRNNSNEQENNNIGETIKELDERQKTPDRHITRMNIPKLTLTSDIENNNPTQSQPSSEYGSPLEYPSSLISSAETTPTPGRRQQTELRAPGRRARSMVRDDDQYYSFDSDEENSYYSISSTGSSRYVVEI